MVGKMTIQQRLITFVVVVCGIQALVAAFVFFQLAQVEHHVKGVAHRDLPVVSALGKATEHQLEQRILFNQTFRYALEIGKEPGAQAHYDETKTEFFQLGEKVDQELLTIEGMLATAALEGSKAEAEEFSAAKKQLESIHSQHKKWAVHVGEVFTELEGQHFHQAEVLAQTVSAEAQNTTSLVEGLLQEIEAFTEGAVVEIEGEIKALEILVIAATLVAIVIALMLAKVIVTSIMAGLNKISSSLATQANGDFSQTVVADELGLIGQLQRDMEGTRKSINEMLAKVADEVGGAAKALDASSRSVKDNTDAQSGEIMQVATAFNEMAATAQEIANNASQTHDATQDAANRSSESQQINSEAMDQTRSLIESLTKSSQALTELEKNSQNIASVVEVIKGIAEQTNLLALNAAIEAARAGDQGRGFAVVADEVRGLAQRTQDSTSEIETMIAQLGNVTQQAVATMEESCDLGDKTIELSRQAAECLVLAGEATAKVNDMNLQVASAAEEQSGVVEEVNVNVNKISEMADATSGQVDQVVDASDQLNATARNLEIAVGRLAS